MYDVLRQNCEQELRSKLRANDAGVAAQRVAIANRSERESRFMMQSVPPVSLSHRGLSSLSL